MVFTIELENPSSRITNEKTNKLLKTNSKLYLLIKKIRKIIINKDELPRPNPASHPSIQLLNDSEESEETMNSRIKELLLSTGSFHNLADRIDWYKGSIVILFRNISGLKIVPHIVIYNYQKLSIYNQIKITDLCKSICTYYE